MKFWITIFSLITLTFGQNYTVTGFPGTNMGLMKAETEKYSVLALPGNVVGVDGNDSTVILMPGVLVQAAAATTPLAIEFFNSFPEKFKLNAPYPNPFNAQTNIIFELNKQSDVLLQIYDIRGRLTTTLVNEKLHPGVYRINWSGRDNDMKKISSGIYLVRISNGYTVKTSKLMLLQ